MEQKPSEGRIVHFVPPSQNVGPASIKLVASMVTQVNPDGTVELATFGPNSLYFQHGIPYSAELKPGHWSWPART